MTNLMTIPTSYDELVTTRWFHSRNLFEVDELVSELAGNNGFINYVNKTNKEILKNPDLYEDMAEKYK